LEKTIGLESTVPEDKMYQNGITELEHFDETKKKENHHLWKIV